MRSSRYNFSVPVAGGVLLYNSASGAVVSLSGPEARSLASLLSVEPSPFDVSAISDELRAQLLGGGFIIADDADELSSVRRRFWAARRDTPMVLTVTTTMDCNLGCYYCYEDRTGDRLDFSDISALCDLVRGRLRRSGKRQLHVDWYGGEPLLNVEFMERASLAIQQVCRELQCTYAASVISYGTCWPSDVGSFIQRHHIKQVQISFDGMPANHDKRRRYRSKTQNSSFEVAAKLVDELLNWVRVDVRINIDPGNQADVEPFLEFVRRRGWFAKKFPAVIQPARLSAYSDRSSFMLKSCLTAAEYDGIRRLVRERVGEAAQVEESEAPDGFPYPRNSVCAALAFDSVVIGADRRQYRCGLQVSESNRAVGSFRSSVLPIVNNNPNADAAWWEAFDPTQQPTCSRCSFLPICWGGCPKKHLEQDRVALDEQGEYWRKNLARLIAAGVHIPMSEPLEFSLEDQFRVGEAPFPSSAECVNA